MIKTQLLIDGNYFLYKCVYMLKRNSAIREDLEKLLKKDINKISKSHNFDQIFFISDKGKSWRKDTYTEYKGTREKDESIDWDFVFGVYEYIKDWVKSKPNFRLLECDCVEGDDYIAYLTKKGNLDGISSIIVSNDGDIQQLLEYSIDNNYINIQWNSRYSDEKLFVPQHYEVFINSIEESNDDIFNSNNEFEFVQFINTMSNKMKVVEVNKEESLFCKIISGDKGDNIITVVKLKDGKWDDEGRGIGADGALTIYKIYKEVNPEEIDFYSESFYNKLVDVIYYNKKIKDPTLREKIKDNIRFNINMVKLDHNLIPKPILENMESYHENELTRIIEYVPEDEEEQFILPEQFTKEKDNFEIDDFFNI